MREFGVGLILLANEVAETAAIRWIAHKLESDESFEFICLEDNPENVAKLDEALDGVSVRRKLHVLVEVGLKDGRAGVRSSQQALEVARAVAISQHLMLAGIETYESLVTSGITPADLDTIDASCERVSSIIRLISDERLFGTPIITVTAGGSAYFDRVVAEFGK